MGIPKRHALGRYETSSGVAALLLAALAAATSSCGPVMKTQPSSTQLSSAAEYQTIDFTGIAQGSGSGVYDLVFLNPIQSVRDGQCSLALSLQIQTARGEPVNSLDAAPISISSSQNPNILFFSDPACSQPMTQLAVLSGTNSAQFYFTSAVSGSITLSAALVSDSTITGAQTEQVWAP